MKRFFLFSFIALCCIDLIAQKEDNHFINGYFCEEVKPNGYNLIDFSDGELNINANTQVNIDFDNSSCAISNSIGNLLFYFNGKEVYHHQHDTMENGVLLTRPSGFGYLIPQGSVILPFPNHYGQYLLIYCEEGWVDDIGNESIGIYYAVVDMAENGGLGKVVQQKKNIAP